jgi:hypothetical protein
MFEGWCHDAAIKTDVTACGPRDEGVAFTP